MVWPIPPLPATRTNATAQFDNHPGDHNAIATAINELAAHAITAWQAPRFRLIGTAPGQLTNTPSFATAVWGAVDSDPLGLTSAGVFACPAAYPGRWRFDYVVKTQAWAGGIRQATLQVAGGATINYAFGALQSQGAGLVTVLGGSAEIGVVFGQSVRVLIYQDSGALYNNMDNGCYFQGAYVGP